MKALEVIVDGRVVGYARDTLRNRDMLDRMVMRDMKDSAQIRPTRRIPQGARRLDREWTTD